MRLKARQTALDDRLPFRMLDVRLGDDSLATPLKASDARSGAGPLTELHKRLTIAQIDALRADEWQERKVNSDIRRRRGPQHNFFFIELDDAVVPSGPQLEALLDLQYEHSDVAVLPILSKVVKARTGDDLIATFTGLIDSSIGIIQTLNDKSILGMVPSRMPRQYLDAVMRAYFRHGVTSFAVDFDGRSAVNNPSWVRHLMRLISKEGIWDECLLYSINSGEGKFLRNAERILAQDFIGTGFGLDVLGLNHIPPRMPKERWEDLARGRKANLVRVFDRADYSYKRVDEASLRELAGPVRGSVQELKRGYNIAEQSKETRELQSRLRSTEPLESYMRTKRQVDDDTIRKMKSVRKDAFRERSVPRSLFRE